MKRKPSFRSQSANRRGNIMIITAFIFPIMLGFVAFAIDWGLLAVARSELQNAADSAALAGGSRMMDDKAEIYLYHPTAAGGIDLAFYNDARDEAAKFALTNSVRGVSIKIDKASDVEIFYLNPATKEESKDDPSRFNTIRVTVHRDDKLNSPLPLLISGMFGFKEANLTAVAQATFHDQVSRLRQPGDGVVSSILPFAVKVSDWQKVLDNAGTGTKIDLDGDGKTDISDSMKYDPDLEGTEDVDVGSDGLEELRMYPDAPGKTGNLTPGNFGTVNVGASSNSASHVSHQITDGLSDADWAYHGGEFDFSKPFHLTGDTGVSAGFKEEMQSIVGQSRTIFLYETVVGNGDNSNFKIVGFAGIRVMDTVLTGGTKGIYVQPAPVADYGAEGGEGIPMYNVTTPLTLTR